MRQELLGWMRFIRFSALWVSFWWIIHQALTAFALWCVLPQGTVLTIIIFLVTYFLTRGSVRYFEQEFFGESPRSTDGASAATRSARSTRSSSSAHQPLLRLRFFHTNPDTGQRTSLYDSHPHIPEPDSSTPDESRYHGWENGWENEWENEV